MDMTRVFLDVFRDHWLVGYGPGLIQKQALAGTSAEFGSYSGIENQYAILLADGGILMGLAFAWYLVGAAIDCLQIMNKDRTNEVRTLGMFTLVAFVASSTVAFGLTIIGSVPNLLLMIFLGGIIALRHQVEFGADKQDTTCQI
jgi:hypothetical protein